jgi:O-acetyl-ADP-ribose deacetylase (regulator of RNase III)
MPVPYLVLACAVVSLVIGLSLFFSARKSERSFVATNLIAWLLIALAPVLVLYSLLPNLVGTTDLRLFGLTASGAVATFVFLFWYGSTSSLKAVRADALLSENQSLKQDLANAQKLTGKPDPRPIGTTEKLEYLVKNGGGRKLCLITGDIENVKNVDAWVSSENTNMQMARFYDRSISGTIRYAAAKKNALNRIEQDVIAEELKVKMEGEKYVEPATVIETSSGELLRTNAVKKIFHVAAVAGQVGVGYRPVGNIGKCVASVLAVAGKDPSIQSILFPLLGAGTAQADLTSTASALLPRAIQFLQQADQYGIQEVCFLVWSEEERAACEAFLSKSDAVAKAMKGLVS